MSNSCNGRPSGRFLGLRLRFLFVIPTGAPALAAGAQWRDRGKA
jgi:hypothetical protein